MNIKLFGEEYITDIMKCVKFIEESNNCVELIVEQKNAFHDNQIEAFIRKFSKILNFNRKMTQDIIKLIPKAEFIMRKKDVVAVALILFYKNEKVILKVLSKECCISELAIKSAIRELQ